MFSYCCIPTCVTHRLNAKLFVFPRNETMRYEWVKRIAPHYPQILEFTEKQLLKRFICIRHFEPAYLKGDKRLYTGCPTLITPDEIRSGIPLIPLLKEPGINPTYIESSILCDHTYHKRSLFCDLSTLSRKLIKVPEDLGSQTSIDFSSNTLKTDEGKHKEGNIDGKENLLTENIINKPSTLKPTTAQLIPRRTACENGIQEKYRIVIEELTTLNKTHTATTQEQAQAQRPFPAEEPRALDDQFAMDVDWDDSDNDYRDNQIDLPSQDYGSFGYNDVVAPPTPDTKPRPVVGYCVAESEMKPEESTSDVFDLTQSKQAAQSHKDDFIQEEEQCRCCLKMGVHDAVNIDQLLGCFNVLLSRNPRLTQRVCSPCGEFLLQAREFRDMVAASQKTLLKHLNIDSDMTEKIMPAPLLQLDAETSVSKDDIKEELLKMEKEPDLCMESEDGSIQELADDGGTHQSGAFSQLSDYPDLQLDTKESYENLTDIDFQKMVKSVKEQRAKLSVFIRENLMTILEYSTILPFLSLTGASFDCIYCDVSYPLVEQLRAHVEEQHREEETTFKHDILKLLPETVMFADISRFNCRLCDQRFTAVDDLVRHLVEVHELKYHNLCLDPPHNIVCFNLSLDVWKCIECGETLPDYKKLRLHVSKHYGSYLCHHCGSKFLFDKQYHQHLKVHRNIKNRIISCDVCAKKFRNRRLLLYHQYKNHYEKTRVAPRKEITRPLIPSSEEFSVAYECGICQNGTSFTDLHAAYMHRIGHLNNTREGPFICEICQYNSPMKKDFKVHLQNHYGIQSYVCEVCKKTFRKSSQLSNHMSSHLNLSFRCPLCDVMLSDKKKLIHHVKNQHPDVTVEFSL